MNPEITNKSITIYSKSVDTKTKKMKYEKKNISNVAFFEQNVATSDTTGIKNQRKAIAIVPYSGTDYSVKLGDYMIEGNGEDFVTLDELKKKHRVYEIMQSDLKLDGNAPHLYIRGV